MRLIERLTAFPLLVLLFTSGAAAASGDVAGTVRDASGGAVANAEVFLMTPGLAVIATSRSDDGGRFTLAAAAPGEYLLVVRAAAFDEIRQPVTVGNAAGPPMNLVLQVGKLREDVTVSASREGVEAAWVAAQPVNVITSNDIAARVKTVVAEAVDGEAGVNLQQTSPTMASSSLAAWVASTGS